MGRQFIYEDRDGKPATYTNPRRKGRNRGKAAKKLGKRLRIALRLDASDSVRSPRVARLLALERS